MADTKTSIIISAEDKTAAAFASARNGLQGLEAAASRLPVLGAALATAFSGATFTAAISDAIKFTASLDDMAEKTGASVETLSGLARVAQIGGHELGMVEQATIKLAKGLADADDKSSGAGRALKALGLSAAELRGMDTGQALKVVADRLAQFEDGAGKSALAMDLLGKSGAQALPFLKDLAEQGELVVTTTAEQAAAAERYEKNMGRLAEAFRGTGRAIAADLMPTLESLSSRLEQAFSDGAIDGFVSRWKAAFRGMAAGINEALATTEEFLAKVTFGRVAENHYKQALQYREAAKKIYSDLAAMARKESAQLSAPTQSLSGYVSADESAPKGAREKRSEVDNDTLGRLLRREDEKEAEALESLRQKYINIADPLQKYRVQLDEINKLRESGALTAAQATEAEWAVSEAMDKTFETMAKGEKAVDSFGDSFKELTAVIDGWGKQASGVIADFVVDGKGSFEGLARSFAKEFVQMVIYQNAMKKLMASASESASASGSWVSELLKAAASYFGGSSGGAGSMSSGGSVQGNADYVYDLHSGGVVGSGEGSGLHARPMSLFSGARRYHGGGLVDGEVPIIAKRGEGVFTPEQMKALGGDVITINVAVDAGGEKASGDGGDAAGLARKLAAACRAIIIEEKRPGGLLAA